MVAQYISSVQGVSSFWGGPPYSGYHPLQALGPPDCTAKGECNGDAPWVSDPSLSPPLGQRVVYRGLTAYVTGVNEAAATVNVSYQRMYKEDGAGGGALRQCHIDPFGATASYPGDCQFGLVRGDGSAVNATVPRAELQRVNAGVWSPLNKQYTAGASGPGGGAFGAEYRWGPLRHNETFPASSGVKYTEWIEVAVEEAVHVFSHLLPPSPTSSHTSSHTPSHTFSRAGAYLLDQHRPAARDGRDHAHPRQGPKRRMGDTLRGGAEGRGLQ